MQYFVKAPISAEVAEQQLSLAAAIRENPQKGLHVDRMLNAALSMADVLFDFFFLRPLHTTKAGSMTLSMVNMGIKTGKGLLKKFAGKAFAKMDAPQLLLFADYLESLVSREDASKDPP